MTALLTFEEAAATQPTWTVSYLRRARREGRLRAIRHGRFYLIHPKELERFRLCPEKPCRPASGDETTAPGSSSIPAASTGRALLEAMLKTPPARRSPATSSPAAGSPHQLRRA